MEKKKNRGKKAIMIIGLILCLLLAFGSGFIAMRKFLNDKKSNDEYKDIEEQVISNDISILNPEIPFYVDFEKLQEINPDVKGWIYIPCIDASYPIMQTDNNEYYLHRTIERTELYAGSIILDCDNASDYSDPNTIIYGHNMMNGSMFGHLWWIVFRGAASEDPYFWIFTPEKVYRYAMFSGYETTIYTDTYRLFNFRNREFKSWCYEMASWSYVDFGEFEFSTSSRVVTLSTCSGTSHTQRTIVQGVQDKELDYFITVPEEP